MSIVGYMHETLGNVRLGNMHVRISAQKRHSRYQSEEDHLGCDYWLGRNGV